MIEELSLLVRLILAAFLAILGIAAALNRHEGLVKYLGRTFYAFIRLIIETTTLGRVKVAPLARRTKYRQRRRLRALKWKLTHLREKEEEPIKGGMAATWQTSDKAEVTHIDDLFAPKTIPLPNADDSTSAIAPTTPRGPQPTNPSKTHPLSDPSADVFSDQDDEDDDIEPPSLF